MNFPEIKKDKIENLLQSQGYKPFLERQIELINHIEKYKNIKLSEFFKFPIYNYFAQTLVRIYGRYSECFEPIKNSKWVFNGAYTMASIVDYIGNIPTYNQEEIKHNVDLLRTHPFIDYSGIYILAPSNNFAFESNIKAIDPIAFALCNITKEKNTELYFIPLSQWI